MITYGMMEPKEKKMSKDSDDCEVMNELFGGTSKRRTDDDDLPYYNHWRPVSIYNQDDTKIRDLTKQEQLEWIKKQKEKLNVHDR